MIYIAPVQGHTDAAWRHFHAAEYGGENRYFTPFIRADHGALRSRDLKDFTSSLNDGIRLTPQVIFRDMDELELLISTLSDEGAKEINLNMGCPFPLQTGKGRGAGILQYPDRVALIPDILANYPDISFSVKMRLGYEDPEEWCKILPILNSLTLEHIALHPRVARQQYGGELYLGQFDAFAAESKNPLIFNGELRTPADIATTLDTRPSVAGVMTARGILGRPSLAAEYESGEEWPKEMRLERMLKFHRALLTHYEDTLCGDTQILSKIKPFWEYAESEIGHKPWKAIKKASNMAKYHSAIAMIGD